MSDSSVTTGAGGTILQSHLIASEQYVVSKIAFGDVNTATDVTPSTPFPVDAVKAGTRAYGTGSRIAISAAGVLSGAITGTEVLLHASSRCFVRVQLNTDSASSAANTDIPLEAGEKFHLRIATGQKIGVIRDTADGFLNIVPVV